MPGNAKNWRYTWYCITRNLFSCSFCKICVKFYNKYITLREIIKYLLATDIYICSSTDRKQVSSGTVAYALSCGKAIISTPFLYAKEVLANNRGIFINFKNSTSIARALNEILSNPELKQSLEKKAYRYGKLMRWSNIAEKYLKVFNEIEPKISQLKENLS